MVENWPCNQIGENVNYNSLGIGFSCQSLYSDCDYYYTVPEQAYMQIREKRKILMLHIPENKIQHSCETYYLPDATVCMYIDELIPWFTCTVTSKYNHKRTYAFWIIENNIITK